MGPNASPVGTASARRRHVIYLVIIVNRFDKYCTSGITHAPPLPVFDSPNMSLAAGPVPWGSHSEVWSGLDDHTKHPPPSSTKRSNKRPLFSEAPDHNFDWDARESEVADPPDDRDAVAELTTDDVASTDALRDAIQRLILEQIERAHKQGATPGVAIYGDSKVRALAKTMLPRASKRAIFMNTLRSVEAYHRALPIFGAPPYSFLMPADASLLRAKGFCASRTNMAYDVPVVVDNYSSFGTPHYVDEHGRHFRIDEEARRSGSSGTSDRPALFEVGSGALTSFVATVRLPRMERSKRRQMIASGANGRQLQLFAHPSPGTTLHLRLTKTLRTLVPPAVPLIEELHVRITSLFRVQVDSPTALIRMQCV